jgi:Co-chaperonin GroES (HSP10)
MSNDTAERPTIRGANTLNYTEIDASTFQPLGDRILVTWEEAHDEIKVGKTTLVRPDTFKKQHYTGEVLNIGPGVTVEIKIGDRILFDQFGNFEKLWDRELGRLALISQSSQGSAFAIIPERTRIGGGEGNFDFDAT